MTNTYKLDPNYVRDNLRNQLTQVALTPVQDKEWGYIRARFLHHCPAFAHILYDLMCRGDKKELALFTTDIQIEMADGSKYSPPAAVDGAHLIINPDEFFQFDLPSQVFIVAHEVLHCVFHHMGIYMMYQSAGEVGYPDGVKLPYIQSLMNQAQDFVINAMLTKSGVGTMPTRDGEVFGCLRDDITENDYPVDVYRKLYEEADKQGRIKQVMTTGMGTPGAGKGFDGHLSPGASTGNSSPSDAAGQRSEQRWKTGVAQAVTLGQSQGDGSANLARLIEVYTDQTVNWQEHIQSFFSRKVGNGGFDWRRADRRLIARPDALGGAVFAPGRSGHGCDTIVVGIDTSGSISQRILAAFFAEMASILEDLRPKRLVVIWCDAEVGRVDEIEDASDLENLRKQDAPGGGGTAFEPVFREIERMGLAPDALVYLTDGYGSFPADEPSYPVLWGDITNRMDAYPFGDVVFVDISQ